MIPHSRPTLGKEEKQACLKVLDSLQIAQGKKTEEFEKAFCRFTGRRYAVAVSSGTAALSLALRVLKVSGGDQVIVPSFNCAALLHAVDLVGAKPVCVDIDSEDFNISPACVKKTICRKTRVVIVPHLFGRAARIREIVKFGIPVIEDGTQALGAHVGSGRVGSFGEISVFSFYATKMMTTGEGGMLLTDSRKIAKALLDMRDYDKKNIYRFRTNSKMTDFQAAIGVEQLKKLPLFIRRRREIASRYRKAFGKMNPVALPEGDESRDHVYSRYVIRIEKNCRRWLEYFNSRGVDAKKPVYNLLHRYLGLSDALFPNSVRALKEVCSIPIYPSMTDADCRKICRAISDAVKALGSVPVFGD